jgi:hypothetical protein
MDEYVKALLYGVSLGVAFVGLFGMIIQNDGLLTVIILAISATILLVTNFIDAYLEDVDSRKK